MTTNIRHALLAVSRPTVLLVVDGSAHAQLPFETKETSAKISRFR